MSGRGEPSNGITTAETRRLSNALTGAGRAAAPASMTPDSVDLIECDNDLKRDQHDDNEFEAQRRASVDEIGQRIGGFRHHGEFPVERIDALAEFVFVFKPGIEPLQVETVP